MERLPSRNNEQAPNIKHPELAVKAATDAIRRVRGASEETTPTTPKNKETISSTPENEYDFWLKMADFHGKTIASQERSFMAKQKRLAKEQKTVPKEEFLEAEDRYAREWEKIQDCIKDGNMAWSAALTAEAEKEVCFANSGDTDTIARSIEVFAANFFDERSNALVQAIRENGGTDDEVRTVTSFYKSVNDHLYFKYMTPSEKRDYGDREYERSRTHAHNNAIKHLNKLNELARKYGTRPFTPRDFLPSDLTGQTEAMKRKMRYDRDAVEEYYAVAFSDEEERAKKRFDRTANFY